MTCTVQQYDGCRVTVVMHVCVKSSCHMCGSTVYWRIAAYLPRVRLMSVLVTIVVTVVEDDVVSVVDRVVAYST